MTKDRTLDGFSKVPRPSGHGMTLCRLCKAILVQCRCPWDPKTHSITWQGGECPACFDAKAHRADLLSMGLGPDGKPLEEEPGVSSGEADEDHAVEAIVGGLKEALPSVETRTYPVCARCMDTITNPEEGLILVGSIYVAQVDKEGSPAGGLFGPTPPGGTCFCKLCFMEGLPQAGVEK